MRDLINKLERIDERQNWDSLNAVIDQYAKTGMTLQDLASMEQAARDVDENTGGLGGFFRGIASSESFRVNYVLYHAGEKLGLSTLIGTDGKIRTLDGGSYRSVKASSRSVQHRNLAVQQARINLLPQAVQTIFSIQQGGANAQLRPTQEFFYTPNATGLQGHSIVRYRGKEPYADMVRQGQQTRVYFEEQYLEQFKAAFPTATVMKADGSGPLEAVATDATDATATATATSNNEIQQDELPPAAQVFDTLDDFANSDLGGLMNDKDQIPAIRELQTFLTTDLGLDTGTVDGAYGPKTTEAVRQFQTAITGIAVDGNVGPETIAKIKEVKADIAKLQEILDSLNESIIPFKSAISQLLEQQLHEGELTDFQKELLQQLLGKYENFRQVFPDFNKDLFTRASTAIGANTGTDNAETDNTETGTDNAETDNTETEDAAYKEVLDTALGRGYRVYDRDGNVLSSGRGDGPSLPLAADWKEVNDIEPEVFIPDEEVDGEETGAETGGETGAETGAKVTVPQANGRETGAETGANDWKDVTSGSAMIDGYSLWRKETGEWAQTINGEQPTDATEEYRIPAMAIAAARRAKSRAQTSGEETSGEETQTKYEVVDGVREYSGNRAMTDAQQDTTLNTGDIIKINGKEAEIYSMPPFNVIYWPGTVVPFDPDGEPPEATNTVEVEEGPLDWMNIQPHDARNRIWKFTVPQDKINQIQGMGVLQDNATLYLRQNQRRGSSVSGWMMARNPGFNAGRPLDSKQDPIVLKLISVLRPLGFDARGAIGLGMDNLGTTGDDILTLWKDAENRFSWDDAKLQDGINRIESREQMLSLLYAYRQQNNGKSLLDEFDDGSTIDDETRQLLNDTFLKFNIPVKVEG